MRKSAEFTMENDQGTLSVRLQELTVREVLDLVLEKKTASARKTGKRTVKKKAQ